MAEGVGLENRYTLKGIVSSNLTLSANFIFLYITKISSIASDQGQAKTFEKRQQFLGLSQGPAPLFESRRSLFPGGAYFPEGHGTLWNFRPPQSR